MPFRLPQTLLLLLFLPFTLLKIPAECHFLQDTSSYLHLPGQLPLSQHPNNLVSPTNLLLCLTSLGCDKTLTHHYQTFVEYILSFPDKHSVIMAHAMMKIITNQL